MELAFKILKRRHLLIEDDCHVEAHSNLVIEAMEDYLNQYLTLTDTDNLNKRRSELGIIQNQIIKITHLFNGGTMVDCEEKLERLKKFVEKLLGESV
ncbi:MAG: hypothetical protein M0Q12_06055 [Synergistaceae bacterium]|jgi:hypothetical protein|nr:hypothetical protein [Synergistaceae bacterium]